MKIKKVKIFSFILSLILLCNTFYCIAYASDSEIDAETLKKIKEFEEARDNQEKWKKTENSIWGWIMSQVGALFNGDMAQVRENDEQIKKELSDTWDNPQWRKDNIQIITGDGTPKIKLTKEVSQLALDTTKKATQATENGGYELIPTIPLRKVSTMYFYTPQQFKTLVNLINDNDGMIGLFIEGSLAYFYKLDSGALWIKHSKNNISNGDETKTFYPVYSIRNVNSGNIIYPGYYAKSYNETALNWEDDANLDFSASKRASNFFMLDTFEFMRGSSSETCSTKPFSYHRYVVTKSGASLPVFNTLNDAIAYTVDHNLYYTSSSYTGEGKEIIIPFDEIRQDTKGVLRRHVRPPATAHRTERRQRPNARTATETC